MSKYFKDKEENMDVDFLAKLDEAREYANIPFIINSAYRSPEHNAKVGGKPGSSHIKGLAVDISAKDSRRFIRSWIYQDRNSGQFYPCRF